MPSSERDLYELPEEWERLSDSPELAAKTRQLARLIPAETDRILDLGCGNGVITNALAPDHPTIGVDWSREALKRVTVPRICAAADALPLREGAFSLILSSELLEHLAEEALHAAAREILRLQPKHLLLSVPHNEDIRINAVRCRDCGHAFNVSYHQRGFSAESLAALFPGYRTIACEVGGPPVRAYPALLLRIRQSWGGRWFQVPADRTVVCPRCGNREFPPARYNPISFFCDAINRLISRRHPYWLFLLLKRG